MKWINCLKKKGGWRAIKEILDLSAKDQAALEKLSFAEVKNNITAFYDRAIDEAKSPYSPTKSKPTIPLDPYSKNYATAYLADRFLWTRAKTQRVLTILALRARADRLEKKTPNVPLPLDPFGAGRLQSKAGVVYSIGPDGVDNGGVLMSARYQVGAKSDVLAPVF